MTGRRIKMSVTLTFEAPTCCATRGQLMIYRDGVKWSATASVFSGFQDVVEVGSRGLPPVKRFQRPPRPSKSHVAGTTRSGTLPTSIRPRVLGSMRCKQAQSRALVLLAAVVSRQSLLQDVDPEIHASEHQDRNNHHDKPINQSLIVANLQVLVTLHLIRKNVKHSPSLRIRRARAGRHQL